MRWKAISLLILAGACGAILFAAQQEQTKENDAKHQKDTGKLTGTVLKILSNHALWDVEFASTVKYLHSWKKLDQSNVILFRDQLLSSKAYQNGPDAERAAARLQEILFDRQPSFAPSFADLLRRADGAPPTVKVIDFFADDDSYRVGWACTPGTSFTKALTIKIVRDELGEPQGGVSHEIVRSERGGRRPVVLTLYRYADGAITYAESDLADKPGRVDRVLLDISKLSAVIFTPDK